MIEIISIFHGCMVWIEKFVTRVTVRHHSASLVMPISDPRDRFVYPHVYENFVVCFSVVKELIDCRRLRILDTYEPRCPTS